MAPRLLEYVAVFYLELVGPVLPADSILSFSSSCEPVLGCSCFWLSRMGSVCSDPRTRPTLEI